MKNVHSLMFSDVKGPLSQIFDVLGGKNGRLWLKGINSFLRQGAIKAFRWSVYGPISFRPFESFEVLMGVINYKMKQKDSYSGNNEYDMGELVKQITYPIKEEWDVEFVSFKVKELGFDNGALVSEIEDCIDDLDLELCKQSDAPRLFSSDDSTINKIDGIEENESSSDGAVFLSKPFFRNLRSEDDPIRPFFFVIDFSKHDNKRILILRQHWSEDKENGKYLLDMFLEGNTKIVLRRR
jgi:hypothetical protein